MKMNTYVGLVLMKVYTYIWIWPDEGEDIHLGLVLMKVNTYILGLILMKVITYMWV